MVEVPVKECRRTGLNGPVLSVPAGGLFACVSGRSSLVAARLAQPGGVFVAKLADLPPVLGAVSIPSQVLAQTSLFKRRPANQRGY
jgi:hypothetical protein